VLDTIAGAILRLFVRVNQIEAMNARLMGKLKALEAPEEESLSAPALQDPLVESPSSAVAPPAGRAVSYTLGEAAKACGRAKPSIARAIATGRFPALRNPDGSFAIDPAELRRSTPDAVSAPKSDIGRTQNRSSRAAPKSGSLSI
jgi:hypothetical protein